MRLARRLRGRWPLLLCVVTTLVGGVTTLSSSRVAGANALTAPLRLNLVEPTDSQAAPTGVQEPLDISDKGRLVALITADYLTSDDGVGVADAYVRDVRAGETTLMSVSPSGGQDPYQTTHPSISGNGRYVAYTTASGGPLPAPPGTIDTYMYVKDRTTGALQKVVVSGNGLSTGDRPLLDGNGTHLAFAWADPNVPDSFGSYVQDRATGAVMPVSISTDGKIVHSIPGSISEHGRYVSFAAPLSAVVPGSTVNRRQVFVRDLRHGITRLISTDKSGAPLPGDLDGRLSGNGKAAVFWQTNSPNSYFHKSLVTGEVRAVDQHGCRPVDASTTYALATISDNGRVVAFQSASTGLVPGDSNGSDDVFVWRVKHPCAVERVSLGPGGQQGNGDSYWPSVSGNGKSVAFVSSAGNLVSGDTNGKPDAFLVKIRRRASR